MGIFFRARFRSAGQRSERRLFASVDDGSARQRPWKLGLSRASELVARYIRPRQEILDEVERFFEEHLSGYYVVGVHMRGTDKQEEITNRLSDSVVLQAVGELVRQLRVPYKIFAASDESHYIGLLRRAFGDRVVSYDAVRSQSGDQPLHRSGCFPRWQIGRDAVVECWLLSKADYLFGSHSNLSMMARCLHPEMHHVCLNDVSDILSSYPARMRHLPPIRYPGRRGEGLNLSDRYRIALPKREYSVSALARSARGRSCGDREHIVILPYYSQREIETFRRLAELWRRLPTGQVRYRFLVRSLCSHLRFQCGRRHRARAVLIGCDLRRRRDWPALYHAFSPSCVRNVRLDPGMEPFHRVFPVCSL